MQLPCFTGTNVQLLTQKALKMEVDEAEELLEQGMEVMHAGAAESEDGGEVLKCIVVS